MSETGPSNAPRASFFLGQLCCACRRHNIRRVPLAQVHPKPPLLYTGAASPSKRNVSNHNQTVDSDVKTIQVMGVRLAPCSASLANVPSMELAKLAFECMLLKVEDTIDENNSSIMHNLSPINHISPTLSLNSVAISAEYKNYRDEIDEQTDGTPSLHRFMFRR
jgi:hypothetical protein